MLREIEGTLDKGIAPVVHLLREGGVNTFASCEGGEGHDFASPTVRIQPRNVYSMQVDGAYIARILSEAGYGGYYLKTVYSYQNSAKPWRPEEQNFIELEFWAAHDKLLPMTASEKIEA